MPKPKIDLLRLSHLENRRDLDRGALAEAEAIVRDLRNQRIKAGGQHQMIEGHGPPPTNEASAIVARGTEKARLTKQIDELKDQLEGAIAMRDAAKEKFDASNALFEACLKFTGAGQ